MPITELDRPATIIQPKVEQSTSIKAEIDPLQTLKGLIFALLERLAALPPSVSSFGLMEHACYRMRRRRTIIKHEEQSSLQISISSTNERGSQRLISSPVAKRHTERMHRGSGKSRHRCNSCGEQERSFNHQCKATAGTLRLQPSTKRALDKYPPYM